MMALNYGTKSEDKTNVNGYRCEKISNHAVVILNVKTDVGAS